MRTWYWELVMEHGELVWRKHIVTAEEREQMEREFAEAKSTMRES